MLLDTNVLLLYLMALADPSQVRTWKRTASAGFTELHVEFLGVAVEAARRLVTTPHVLTETTDLSDKVPGAVRTRYSC